MSLDAGSVYTILGGKFVKGGFAEFDAANKQAVASATAAESGIANAAQRTAKAHDEAAAAAGRNARATEEVAKSGSRLRETLPLAAMDSYSKNSAQAEKNLSKLGSVAAKGTAVGILAIGAATVYAAAKATSFNREMLKISTQAGGSAAEVKKLSSEVLSMAGSVPQGPQKLAEGLYHIESAGFRGAQSMSMLKAAAEGAALGNADLQDTTQAMIATMASNIKGVHGSADAMGQLNDIVGVGDMRMQQLAQAMATGLLPSAHDAGLSLKDVGAALATVTDNATPANVTATRLRMTIALLAAPSKAATKELESIGLTSTSLAHDMRQPNGLLVAVEDLKTHLHASGKSAEEQDAILSKVFGGGKSSAVIHTLISETGRLREKYDELGTSNGPAKLAKSWGEFQASQSASFGELKSGAEAFAITVGNVVLPTLTKLAHEGAHALDGFVSSGGAQKLGNDISSGFDTLGQVIGNIAPIAEGTAKALLDVGHAVGLANPAELTALIAAFATFKGVSFVAPILASAAGAISEIGLAASTAPSLAAFGADLVAMAGPAGLIAAGLALAAGAFVAFDSGLFSSASAAEKNAAALQADKAAVEGLANETQNAASANTAAERAQLSHKEAGEALKKVEKEVADGSLKGAAASNALLGARLRVAESGQQVATAHQKATKALNDEIHTSEKAQKTIGSRQQETLKSLAALEQESQALGKRNFTLANGESAEQRRNKLQAEYNQQSHEAAQAAAEVAVAEESRHRIEAGKGAITAQNAQGVKQLQDALFESGASKKIVTRYELDDQGAQAKLGQLSAKLTELGQQHVVAKVLTTAPSAGAAIAAMRAVLAGVPAHKVISILHNAPSAKAAISALHGAVNAVPGSKSIAINTNAGQARSEIEGVQSAVDGLSGKTIAIAVQKTTTVVENIVKGAVKGHASGRSRGPLETALVGEGGAPEWIIDSATGKGAMVSQPTLVGLSPDDYVVPLEDRYRGRALGLFAMLARDLEVPGYAKGKAPAKGKAKGGKAAHPMPIPNAIQPLSLPVADIESKRDATKTAESKLKTKVKSETGKIASLEKQIREASRAKKPDHAKLGELRGELSKERTAHTADSKQLEKDKQELKEWNRTVREARAFAAKIKHVELEVSNDRNAMQLAASHGDFGAYTAAKNKRIKDLGHLGALIQEARDHVKTGSDYALELEGQIQQAQIEAGTTSGEEPEAVKDKAGEEEESTGMTASERAEERRIERDIALAALTPDLGDDTARAQELVSFLSNVLGETEAEPGPRGGDEGIKQVAEALKSAQNNLTALTAPGGSATSESSDLQAQITQANERAEAAKAQAQTAERALAVFGGSGDIGAGGSNAAQAAAGVTQNIYTLHPGDPQTLSAIGAAATAGIGLQGNRQAVRVQVGP